MHVSGCLIRGLSASLFNCRAPQVTSLQKTPGFFPCWQTSLRPWSMLRNSVNRLGCRLGCRYCDVLTTRAPHAYPRPVRAAFDSTQRHLLSLADHACIPSCASNIAWSYCLRTLCVTAKPTHQLSADLLWCLQLAPQQITKSMAR